MTDCFSHIQTDSGQKRGLTTISPPAKVKNDPNEAVKILASNLDSLVLAIDVNWTNDSFFQYLENAKERAKSNETESSISLYPKGSEEPGLFLLKPHGSSNGYAWVIDGKEYSMLVGGWLEPIQRPSIMVNVHSETLWHLGPERAIERLYSLIEGEGGVIQKAKVSRVDPCLDILMPEHLWSPNLVDQRVTRSRYAAPHFENNLLTGITIGKGKMVARLYDKPKEIAQQSKKFWLYPIWKIRSVPDGFQVIRVEFQIRRETLVELHIDTVDDLFEKIGPLWAYCSQKWLKFRTRPGEHHTMRKTLEWWKTVQNGFQGFQGQNPLVREKALRSERKHLAHQALGYLTSHGAATMEDAGYDRFDYIDFDELITFFKKEITLHSNFSNEELNQEIFRKRAKYKRSIINQNQN